MNKKNDSAQVVLKPLCLNKVGDKSRGPKKAPFGLQDLDRRKVGKLESMIFEKEKKLVDWLKNKENLVATRAKNR